MNPREHGARTPRPARAIAALVTAFLSGAVLLAACSGDESNSDSNSGPRGTAGSSAPGGSAGVGGTGSSTGGSSGGTLDASSSGGSSGSVGSSSGGSAGNGAAGSSGRAEAGPDGSTGTGGTSSGAGGTSGGTGGTSGGTGGTSGATGSTWSAPRSLVDDLGRLAIGNQVHVVGHTGNQLVHRRSADDGATWSAASVIAPASGNFPAMYGGLFAEGDTVYLITASSNMDSSAAAGGTQLDFRKSSNNGATWSAPVRITSASTPIFRARIAARGEYVHVAGTSNPQSNASFWYFRSADGGAMWTATALATNLGAYGGGQTVAVDGATVHAAYTQAINGVGAGPTLYRRSIDNGATWSQPVAIGENTAQSSRQARVQLAAADGRVFACWQREGEATGGAIPADRIGYNRSLDGGQTWGTARVLPEDTGVDRNHQHVWLAAGGGVHILWRHGDSGDTTPDPAGYVFSPDYGANWTGRVFAVDTTNTLGANHPWNIVANAKAVHVLTGPEGTMQYARRLLP